MGSWSSCSSLVSSCWISRTSSCSQVSSCQARAELLDVFLNAFLGELPFSSELLLRSRASSSSQVSSFRAHAGLLNELSDELFDEIALFGELLLSSPASSVSQVYSLLGSCRALEGTLG